MPNSSSELIFAKIRAKSRQNKSFCGDLGTLRDPFIWVNYFLGQWLFGSIKLFWVESRPEPQSSTSRTFSVSHWLSKRIFRPILVIISFEPSARQAIPGKEARAPITTFSHVCKSHLLLKKNLCFLQFVGFWNC